MTRFLAALRGSLSATVDWIQVVVELRLPCTGPTNRWRMML